MCPDSLFKRFFLSSSDSSISVDFVLHSGVLLMIIYFPDDYFIKEQLGKELRTHVVSDAKMTCA